MRSITHKADWIIVDPWTIIHNGFVRVDSGIIQEVGQGKCNGNVINHGNGALMPALVNTHVHLELCALKGKIPFEKGFRFWVEELINLRKTTSAESLYVGAENGAKELIESGCKLIGEISTLGNTWEVMLNSRLAGVWFREFLGNVIKDEIKCDDANKQITKSLAGHAPHTTSPEFLVYLKNKTKQNNMPFSIHLAESEDEVEFLATGKGNWADFLTSRGIDFSNWNLSSKSPTQHLDHLGILDKNTIAVHLVHATKKDFEILAQRKAHVCLCLRSNNNLHKKMPDIEGILKAGIKPCLGTDSLASVDSLNMFDEMAFVANRFPNIASSEILAAATINGANALGFGNIFGSLTPRKHSALIYAPVNVSNRSSLLDAIVNADLKKNHQEKKAAL